MSWILYREGTQAACSRKKASAHYYDTEHGHDMTTLLWSDCITYFWFADSGLHQPHSHARGSREVACQGHEQAAAPSHGDH